MTVNSTRRICNIAGLFIYTLAPLALPIVAQAQDTVPRFPGAPRAHISREFPISYWLGPTENFTNLERYQEIKNAGMTFVMPQFESGPTPTDNLKYLDLAHKIGQKAFVYDTRMPFKITGDDNAKANLDAIIKDYKKHPGLAGYYIIDEPNASLFPGLAEVVAYLREKDPEHPAYINLFPNYANAQQLGTASYEEYVREFIKQVQPFVLSWDHYNLTTDGDGNNFYPNLMVMNKLSKEFNIPFWQIVQVVQFGNTRNLTEDELRYEAMQTLAYGGKGLLWFTYWQSRSTEFDWQQAMINKDGTRNPHYDMVKNVNAEVRAIGGELLQAENIAVFHSGQIPQGTNGRSAGTPVEVMGGGNLTVGVFRHGKNEYSALVTNADYKAAVQTEVLVYSGNKAPRLYNARNKKWVTPARTALKPVPGGFSIGLDIAAGGAALLKW